MSDPQHDRNRDARKGRRRWTAVGLAAVTGLAIGGGAYAWRASQEAQPQITGLEQAGIGGPFKLVDQDGRPTDQSVLNGKWSAVFFGYTACPDFCPNTLQTLQAATQTLGPAAKDLQVVLITVDPARDTPEVLKAYLDGYEFPGGAKALTGTEAQIDAATKAWRVYRKKAAPPETSGGQGGHEGHQGHQGYLVDHTTVVYLVNPQGRFVEVLSGGLTPQQAAERIRAAQARV
jgi:protein SCO1/2